MSIATAVQKLLIYILYNVYMTNLFPALRSIVLLFTFSLFCLSGFSASGLNHKDGKGDEIVTVGQVLPNFSVSLPDGTEIAASSLKGKAAVIVFFNTACIDCRRELPVLQELYQEFGKDVTFLCISREEAAESVAAYWQQNALTLPVSAQVDRAVYSLFAQRTIPRVYVCNTEGVVSKVFVEKASRKKLRKAIVKAMECQTVCSI